MRIQFTRTIEYMIDVADDDTIGLNEVDAILSDLAGDDMAERVEQVYLSDPALVMSRLAGLAATVIEDETWTCDSAEGPEPEDDEENDEDRDLEDEQPGPRPVIESAWR